MFSQTDFYESLETKNNFFINSFYILFILIDLFIGIFLLISCVLYLPEKTRQFINVLYGKDSSIIYFGLMNLLSNFSIGIFLYSFYKKTMGIILKLNSSTKKFYIKYLIFYLGKENYWDFSSGYNSLKKGSNAILYISFLFSLYGLSFFSSIDRMGMHDHFSNYKYKNISWGEIKKIEYKLILWYDQRKSRYKLREKFLISGSFGELDILDYENGEQVLKIISLAKNYSHIIFNSDNPNEPDIKKFLENFNEDEKDRIFKIYEEIIN